MPRLVKDGSLRVGGRTVQVTSVVRASDQSYQVKWIETAFDRGAQTGTSHWTGILTVKLIPPATADTLRKNPLGVYVDAIDWSRELDPASGASAPATSTVKSADPTGPTGLPVAPSAVGSLTSSILENQ